MSAPTIEPATYRIGNQTIVASPGTSVINDVKDTVKSLSLPLTNSHDFLKSRILIIDDEAINVRLIHKCLQLAGYSQIESHGS